MEKTNIDNNSKEFIKMVLDVSYEDYEDFVENNNDLMFRNIIKIFDELSKNNDDTLQMVVESDHNNRQWSTNFVFSRDKNDTLITNILPFFEEKEEYELCGEIVRIHKKLNL